MDDAFRRRVQARLVWLGLTQSAFAHAIGMDEATFCRSLRRHPRRRTIERIATGLDLPVRYLTSPQPDNGIGLEAPHRAFVPAMAASLDEERKVALLHDWVWVHHGR